eukprot:7276041-Prymnesium_polylepis.1
MANCGSPVVDRRRADGEPQSPRTGAHSWAQLVEGWADSEVVCERGCELRLVGAAQHTSGSLSTPSRRPARSHTQRSECVPHISSATVSGAQDITGWCARTSATLHAERAPGTARCAGASVSLAKSHASVRGPGVPCAQLDQAFTHPRMARACLMRVSWCRLVERLT